MALPRKPSGRTTKVLYRRNNNNRNSSGGGSCSIRIVVWSLLFFALSLVAYLQLAQLTGLGRLLVKQQQKQQQQQQSDDRHVLLPFATLSSSSSAINTDTSEDSREEDENEPLLHASQREEREEERGEEEEEEETTAGSSYKHFDDECYLVDSGDGGGRQSNNRRRQQKQQGRQQRRRGREQTTDEEKEKGVGKSDKLNLGRCRYEYPTRVPPSNGGYTKSIDYFHFRHDQAHTKREDCFLFCLTQLRPNELNKDNHNLLVQAAIMGLPRVVDVLKTKYGLDALQTPTYVDTDADMPGLGRFNAIQESIRGGHADVLQVLLLTSNKNKNNKPDVDLVIDELGRTVKDYLQMRGSPIRPSDAQKYLSLKIDEKEQAPVATDTDTETGWSQETDMKVDLDRCDIEVLHGKQSLLLSREDFYNNYFMTGRPVVLRNVVDESELQAFHKQRWTETTLFHPTRTLVRVGPTAYPSLSGQHACEHKLSIVDLENKAECDSMPGIPMVHGRHPKDEEWEELYPMYEGDIYHRRSGWRKLEQWFGKEPWEYNMGWQVFFGGDLSGATLHWHNAAFNILYVGVKAWTITPPKYRGFTGMPARDAAQKVDPKIALQCTQHPGDLIFIPDNWGHLTVNSGFAIGAAVILPASFQLLANAKPKIFFVHINKNGGTSVIEMLKDRCSDQYTSDRWSGGHRTFHATAHSMIDYYGRDQWDISYTFAVVRHPLARQVSNFFFLLDRCSRKYSRLCKGRLIPELDPSEMTDEEKIEVFHEYIAKLYDAYPPGSPDNYLFGSWGHGNEEFSTMNATQTSWMVDEQDNMVVKKIFHLESLSRDMGELAEEIPCLRKEEESKAVKRRRVRGQDEDDHSDSDEEREGDDELESETNEFVKMVHKNSSPKYPDYKLFGKNAKTNRIMKEVFGVDYKNFGYEI